MRQNLLIGLLLQNGRGEILKGLRLIEAKQV
jgi:hypothetical protein